MNEQTWVHFDLTELAKHDKFFVLIGGTKKGVRAWATIKIEEYSLSTGIIRKKKSNLNDINEEAVDDF